MGPRLVFLSSTGRDLAEYREAAFQAIQGMDGYHCVRQEDFGARDQLADDYCRSRVAECQLFVGLVGHLYGSSPPGTGRSFTEREYLAACRAKVPRLMFVTPEDFPLPARLIEADARRRRQQAFRRRVGAECIRAEFNTPADLAGKVRQAIHNWQQKEASRPPSAEPAPGTGRRPRRTGRSGAVAGACPYRGLFAFGEADTAVFFGRTAATRELVRAVHRRPLVAVLGPSGSGKSSVVFAGLVPRLRRQGGWLIASFRPGDRPCHNLAAALLPLLEPRMSETARLRETRTLRTEIWEDDHALPDVAGRIRAQGPAGCRLLLIADQFEELYTLCRDAQERQRFLDRLLSAAGAEQDHRPPDLVVVLTLRADFAGHALSYRPFADALQHADWKLGPMTRTELRAAVARPARRRGVRLEKGLTERILNAVGQEPGSLPLLEFALTQLWERRQGERLTHAAYDAVGGVGRALARYADIVFGRLDEAEQARGRAVFLQLVAPGQGTEDTRRRASRAEVGASWELVTRLANDHLVVTDRDPTTGAEVVEVVHEALIREWTPLRQWVEHDREFRTWQERLRAALRQWERSGRDEGALLRGAPLAEAEGWLGQRPDGLNPAEEAFIRAGRERQAEETARWQKLSEELSALNKTLEERVKERTSELARERQLFRVTLTSIAGVVIATDTASRIMLMNQTAEVLSGWREDNALGHPLEEVFHLVNEQTRQSADDLVDRVVREGVVVGLAQHTVFLTRDGIERPVDGCAAPLRDGDGRVVGSVLFAQDVSERRELERELQRQAEALKEADRRKNEFLAMLSHELRNPLAPVRNGLQLLRMPNLAPEAAQRVIAVMERQIKHMSRLVDDLLDISRISRGVIVLRKESVDLVALAGQALETMRPALEARGQQPEAVLPPAPVLVDGDPVRLQQVMHNLLSNASKFTDAGGRMGLEVQDAGHEALLRVWDEGIGIPEELLPHVFDLFVQADRSLDRSRGGLGIGLTLVKNLVELHGGQVEAHSDGPGKGSAFVVRLPALREAPAPFLLTGDVPVGSPRRVLVVDDNHDSAEGLGMMLQLMGHEAELAHDGQEALTRVRDFRPDVVLLDIGLPGMDGYAVARAVGQEPGRPVLVAITGYGQEEDRRQSQKAGFDHHLVKPIDPEELMRLLASLPE